MYPGLAEPAARSAVHAVFGLLNSTPHLGRPGALPGRAATAALLHRMARGAFAARRGRDERLGAAALDACHLPAPVTLMSEQALRHGA